MNRFQRLRSFVIGQLLVWTTKLCKAGLVDFQVKGLEHVYESIRQGRPVIFAGWHGQNFLTMCHYHAALQKHFKETAIMVPDSNNGNILYYFGKKMDFTVIKVQSELGPSQWVRATVSMIKLIRNGYCALLSPDGPDGPPCKVKPGIAVIARQTKAVVIPASVAANRSIKLKKRWDQHLIPLPFTSSVIYFGSPIDTNPVDGPCPSDAELQEMIEQALIEGVGIAEECYKKQTGKDGVG